MSIKTLKKIKMLSKTNRIFFSNGKAHFTNHKEHGWIWVTIDSEMEEGHYTFSKGELLNMGYSDIPEMNLGVDLNAEMPMVDVTDIPYEIVNFVSNDKDNSLSGIYFDKEHECIVATDGRILYTHELKDIPESILIRPEFWKLLHHFKLTQIFFNDKYSIAKGDGVTIICELITREVYPSWFHCVPKGNTHIEITDKIKKDILKALKLLKPHYILNMFVVFDGTDIKVVSGAGLSFKINIGVELFPDKVIMLDANNLKKVLKLAQGYINFPKSKKHAVTISNNDSTSLIMPFPLPDDSMLNTTFVEFNG